SVGMKQRINLARGLCVETDVLLLDEPFAALDEQTRMVLGEDLSILLARTGKTIVFVTHSLSEAVFLADRIVVMTARPGKVKASMGEGASSSEAFFEKPPSPSCALWGHRLALSRKGRGRPNRLPVRGAGMTAHEKFVAHTIQLGVLAALFGAWFIATRSGGALR